VIGALQDRRLVALLAFAGISGIYAQTGDSDWQEYGLSKVDKLSVFLFFDAAGIVRRGSDHVEVWTKALSLKALDRADTTASTGKKILKFFNQRLARHYRPPIAALMELDRKKLIEVMMDEAAANVGDIEANARVLYELDCTNRLLRELSTYAVLDGKTQYKDTPDEWRHVPPETIGANLLKLACTQH
jgi:hypothetical protein